MITDKLTTFATATATGNTGTNILGNQIDIEDVRDLGNGQPVYLVVLVGTGIKLASSTGTYQVNLRSDSAAAMNVAAVTHITSPSFATSTTSDVGVLKPGTVLLNVALPMGTDYKRYLAVSEIVGSQNTSAGSINAFLTLDPYGWKAYAQSDIG